MPVHAVPEGYHNLTPYLMLAHAADFIAFLHTTFGAEEMFRMPHMDGSIRHAEVRLGDSMLMLSEATESHPANPGMFYLYVDDVDATYRLALTVGAISLRQPRNEFYGDRSAGIKDGWGNIWWLATHIANVAPEEVEQKYAELRQTRVG